MRDFFEIITRFGEWYVLGAASLAMVIMLVLSREYPALKTFMIVLFGVLITTYLLKYFIGRPRPTELVSGYSYVSGHSSLAMLIYGFMANRIMAGRFWTDHGRYVLMGLLIVLIFAIGYSRVCLDAHYWTDVLAGWTIGFIWLYGATLRLRIR